MLTIAQPECQIPVIAEADVVVCGAGPGGLAAAMAAARHGAQTLLVERYGFLGGLATAGLVAPILGHTAHESSTPIVEGILREITERMHALGGAPTWQEALEEWGIRFDAEALKIVADEMVQEAGIQVLLHTYVSDVVRLDEKIEAVLMESKSGRHALRGKVFVDATGDADVAYRAGAPVTHGRDSDGRSNAMGSFFHLAGLPPLSDEEAAQVQSQIEREMANGRLHFYNPGFLARNTYHTDHSAANMTRYGGDADLVQDLSQAEFSTRREVWKLVRYLRANVKGFENCYVQQTSPQVGPRESRQIVGLYALTGDDIYEGHKFEDAIARGSWWIDIHCPLGRTYPVHLCTAECPEGKSCPHWVSHHESMRSRGELYPPPGDWYDIPYRCLLSVSVPNLLAAGRCLSATHEGMAGARVMGTCMAIGQAAGTAAALAVQQDCAPTKVEAGTLRRLLANDGQLV